ncbi:MAG: extracellular solute-binding protein [Ruminococcaceae bacterium]|nr:extracellular solute-binding protein [Oscillospiraceae bacterium]
MNKKLTAILLALAMLASSAAMLASCSDSEGTPDETSGAGDTTVADTTADTTPVETAPPTPYDYITKKWDGKTFTIGTPNSGTRYIPGQFLTEEETGDIIMDSAYKRNLAVSEKFGVTIKHLAPANQSQSGNLFRTEIQASSDAYDLIAAFVKEMAPLGTSGLFVPSSELPYQADISNKPWYNANLNNALQVNGRQFQFFSDMTCITLSCTYGMFYNVSLGEANGIKDVDKLALDGKFTFDKMLEYSANISKDLNNDGVMDKNDQFGVGQFGNVTSSATDTAMTYMYGFGIKTAEMKDGKVEILLNSEKTVTAIEKLVDMYYTGNRTAHMITAGKENGTAFAEGKILFWNAIIMHAGNYMRDMKDTFVALPMPKWDENQEEYYTTISAYSSHIEQVPVSAKDKEFSSAIYDALAYEGNQQVAPAFFEYSMKLKFSADNTASQLFDIIRAGTVVDFGMFFDNNVKLYFLPAKLLSTKSTNFASEFAALKDTAEANYKKVLEEFAKLG